MQKTVLEMRVSDWSSDVCSSDLKCGHRQGSCRRLQPGAVAQDFRRGDFPADEAGIPMPAIPAVFPQPKVLEQATGVLWPGTMGHISGNRVSRLVYAGEAFRIGAHECAIGRETCGERAGTCG